MNLKEYLNKYKEITLAAIQCGQNEQVDELEELIHKRACIIEEMKHLNYTKDEFKNICDEYGIVQCEKQLTVVINIKKNEAKRKMNDSAKSRKVKNNYNTVQSRAVFLAREV